MASTENWKNFEKYANKALENEGIWNVVVTLADMIQKKSEEEEGDVKEDLAFISDLLEAFSGAIDLDCGLFSNRAARKLKLSRLITDIEDMEVK